MLARTVEEVRTALDATQILDWVNWGRPCTTRESKPRFVDALIHVPECVAEAAYPNASEFARVRWCSRSNMRSTMATTNCD